MAPEEVDLTSSTPPKKMKQARLPFALRPHNKQDTVADPKPKDGSRKRKHSGSEATEENLTPSKTARTEEKSNQEVSNSIKSKLAVFANTGESASKKSGSEASEEKKDKRNIKPKKEKSKQIQDNGAKDEITSSEKQEKDGGKFHGLLKMPFMKTKKKEKKDSQSQDTDDDFELVLESSVDESVLTEEASITSISSMTDEWAKFHESQDTDQSMDDLETEAKIVPTKKTKIEKQKEKEEKLKKKEEEKALAKADKEKQKKLQKEEKEKLKEETKAKPAEKVEDKPAVKVNPLAKFIIRGKVDKKPVSNPVVQRKEENVSSAPEAENSKPDTSTPTQLSSPQQESSDPVSTPLTNPPSMTSTPVTPSDPDRAKKLNIAKLKIKMTELNIAMEKAVDDKDFLKAHEAKEQLKNLEESIKKMESDSSYPIQAVLETVEDKKSSTAATPSLPKTPRNVSVVSTPGSSKSAASKGTKRELLEKERQAKKEALEKEKQAKKEALELEKKEKKDAKERERIEKERLRELEKQAKAEEKMEKERQRKAEKEKAEAEKLKSKLEKEEEKQRKKAEKEAELKQKEEEKRLQEIADKEKAKKEANVFRSFFKKEAPREKKENEDVKSVEEKPTGILTAFRVKKDMRLAPLVRADPERAKKNIDSLDMPSGPEGLYLALLSDGYTAGRQGRTWPYEKPSEKEEDDVEILEDEEEEESDPEDELNETNINIIMRKGDKTVKTRAKLLKFHENQRPAYWGTWTKTSKFISGRRPFGKDEERFDYDYDSDEDWEEEEEGESLSDDEKDKEEDEENEDYEVDNEFFVPHGYLSDEEEDKDDDEVLDPETAKEKQKLAAKVFEREHKKKTQELKPRLWGCYFPDGEELKDAATIQMAKILNGYTAIMMNNNSVVETSFSKKVSSPIVFGEDAPVSAKTTGTSKGPKAKQLPEEAIVDLIRLVHGNNNNKMFLAREFLAFWRKKSGEETKEVEEGTPSGKGGTISKRKVVDKIQELADYRRPEEGGGRCWLVKSEILAVYGVSSPKAWDYILDQPNKNGNSEEGTGTRPESPACKNTGTASAPTNLITKFARVLTEEEKEEARARQEREAMAAKQKKEELAAKQAAKLASMKAELAMKQVGAGQPSQTCSGAKVPESPLQRFTKTLSDMEKKGQLSSDAPVKKRVALTPVLISAKNNPIVSIAGGPQAVPSNKAPVRASPIAVKRKPGNSGLKASPIAVKRVPGPPPGTSSPSAPLSFKGMLPDSITLTTVRSQEPPECVTIDD